MNIHMQKYAHCDAQSLANEFGNALLHCTGASCIRETSQGKIRLVLHGVQLCLDA